MIGTLRKHSQWLWVIIIIITCVSFVIFFTPEVDNLGGGGRGEENFGTLHGKPVKREDLLQAGAEAKLGFRFAYRQWPGEGDIARRVGFDFEREARQRLLMTASVRRSGITVPDDVVIAFINNIFQDQSTRAFSTAVYENFLQDAARAGVSEQAFETFLRHEIAIAHLTQVRGLSGKLISSRAAEAFFRREHEEISTQAVFLHTSNQVSQVKIETNAIAAYFTTRMATYRIPERVVVDYVYLPYTNFNAEAEKIVAATTNLAAKLEGEYTSRGTNAFKDGDKVLDAAAARERIRQELIEEEATKLGGRKMVEFANSVFKLTPVKAENLKTVAKQFGFAVQTTPPFTELDGPGDLRVPGNFARTAFDLSAEEPLASPLNWVDGQYLLAFNRRVPSEAAALSNVWDKVVADYQRSQAQELTLQNGIRLAQSITNGLAAGKSFEALCQELKVEPLALPPITRATRSIAPLEDRGVMAAEFRDLAFSLAPGQASAFRQGGHGGYIAYVASRKPVPPERFQTDLPKFLDDLRENRVSYAFQDWFRTEAGSSGLFSQQPPAPSGGGEN